MFFFYGPYASLYNTLFILAIILIPIFLFIAISGRIKKLETLLIGPRVEGDAKSKELLEIYEENNKIISDIFGEPVDNPQDQQILLIKWRPKLNTSFTETNEILTPFGGIGNDRTDGVSRNRTSILFVLPQVREHLRRLVDKVLEIENRLTTKYDMDLRGLENAQKLELDRLKSDQEAELNRMKSTYETRVDILKTAQTTELETRKATYEAEQIRSKALLDAAQIEKEGLQAEIVRLQEASKLHDAIKALDEKLASGPRRKPAAKKTKAS